ncbi:cytochrome c oxidase assembly factor 3 homolog, mitochondrial [Bufo gargarizans]|uniref:cytochrome c oxidase assembly factor 3 homolog, mitochondrial n=1 Tax=Bufo gargarizans TaxID=30331 RepID=UPI001CF17D47|nr:cytochrome c oxidase assembly factor 3 homolog, mitochondrial [Bufo gargarizans]
MADKGSAHGPGSMEQEKLTREQIRSREMAYWAKNSGRLRTRNIFTGLAIGGIVLGIYGYTFFSVSQEKFLDELEDEAKVVRANYPKTSAN